MGEIALVGLVDGGYAGLVGVGNYVGRAGMAEFS